MRVLFFLKKKLIFNKLFFFSFGTRCVSSELPLPMHMVGQGNTHLAPSFRRISKPRRGKENAGASEGGVTLTGCHARCGRPTDRSSRSSNKASSVAWSTRPACVLEQRAGQGFFLEFRLRVVPAAWQYRSPVFFLAGVACGTVVHRFNFVCFVFVGRATV